MPAACRRNVRRGRGDLLWGAHIDRETLTEVREAGVVDVVERELFLLLFRGAAAVLADSDHEPFGLVGLEAMAVGGVACTGGTGEDYATRGHNALVLAGGDPRELACLLSHLRQWPEAITALGARALRTARDYAWDRVVEGHLLPLAREPETA